MPVTRFNISRLLPYLKNGALILTPNYRISDAIHQAYDEHQINSGQQSWISARVFAIDIWLMEYWAQLSSAGKLRTGGQILLTGSQELLIWSEIIEKKTSSSPLINLLDTAKAARMADQLLNQWTTKDQQESAFDSHINSHSYTQSFSKDMASFYQWKKEFEQYCLSNNLLNLTAVVHTITEVLAHSRTAEPGHKSALSENEIVLVSFDSPPPLYENLFQQLQTCSKKNLVNFHSLQSTPETILRQKTSDQTTEIQMSAQWARQIIDKDSSAHIGIITTRVNSISNTVQRIFSDVLNPQSIFSQSPEKQAFNSASSSASLGSTAYIQHALQLLSLNNFQQETMALCLLLRSPFLIQADAERESRIKLELVLRKKGELKISMPEFRWLLQQENQPHHCPLLGTTLQKVERLAREAPDAAHSDQWADLFKSQLELFKWEDCTESNQSQRKPLEQWIKVLDEFSKSKFIFGKINLSSALGKLKVICNNTQLHKPFLPGLQISFYTPTEAIGLQFDHLWYMGLDDQSFPEPAKVNPFIPAELQKQCSMPGYSAQSQKIAAENTINVLTISTKNTLIFSYHEVEGENKLRPSQLILPMDTTAPFFDSAVDINPFAIGQYQEKSIEFTEDDEVVPLKDTENPRGGSRLLSNQSQCPFRAFATHRLGAETLAEIQYGLSAMARGNAIHLVMDAVWKNIGSSIKLQTMEKGSLHSLVDKAVTIAIDFLTSNYPQTMTPAYKMLERERLSVLTLLWLEEDKKRSPFNAIATEKKVKWANDKLSLSLTVDRIDQLEDHSLILIDYKTGRNLSQGWLDEKPEELQLPLYCIAVQDDLNEEINGILFARINIHNMAYLGVTPLENLHPNIKSLGEDKNASIDWPELKLNWRNTIKNLASEFCQGHSQVAPQNKNTCQYCDLHPLCRIQEISQLNSIAKTEI